MRFAFQLPGIASAFFVAASLTSCTYSRPDWQEEKFETLRFEQVWVALEESVRACGYTPDEATTDRGEKKMMSRWRTREMPFSKGERTRVVAEVVMADPPAQGVELRFHVERQINRNMKTSFNPEESDWEPSGQEVNVEARLRKHLKLRSRSIEGSGDEVSPAANPVKPAGR